MLNIIYDNIIFNLQRSGGISVYWKELIERIVDDPFIVKEFIEYPKASENIFRKELKISSNDIKVKNSFPSLSIRRYTNIISRITEKTIFHSSYYRIMKGKNVINIITVHDFTYEKKMKSLIGLLHIYQKRKAIKNADGIICISENTKNDLKNIYPKLINKKNIKVIYNGYNTRDYFVIPNAENKNSVIFVGARKGYKNFLDVVEIVSRLDDVLLDIVGAQLDKDEIVLLEKKLHNRYKVYSHVSNKKLNELYNKAICLMYLSEYEGFGIPVIEAMSAGCPVIALNKSSVPEVAGNAGFLFDQINYEAIGESILQLRDNKIMRENLIELGLINSKRFSWDKCYKEVINFYQEFVK